jgi:hypothetical protein
LRDGQGGQGEVVAQKHQPFAGYGIEIAHPAQCIRVARGGCDGFQHDGLVRVNPGASIHRVRVAALEQRVLLGAHHEEGPREGKGIEPLQIDVAANSFKSKNESYTLSQAICDRYSEQLDFSRTLLMNNLQ